MRNSPEELRQAAIADVLKPAYMANQVVTLTMRDGSERTGLLQEFRDNYAIDPTRPMGWAFEVRLMDDNKMIAGSEIMAGTVTSGG